MGLYARHIGPRIVACVCGQKEIAEERAKLVPQASGTVLEIGIGPGHNLALYDPTKVDRVIGVDPLQGFLDIGGARHARSPVPLEIRQAPAEALPLPDASIDTAVVTFTLCSVDDPERALREIRRVLKPGGRMLVLEHGLSDEPGVARWQRRLNPVWRRLAVGCNLDRATVGLAERAGFTFRSLDRFYLPGTPKPVGYMSRGVATAA